MKVVVIGKGGNVGGALADLWERAGHEVARIGREGGNVSDAEAEVVAVHGGAIGEALDRVQDQIGTLTQQLEDRKEEARRKGAILLTMAQRIPELEAPSEARESPVTLSEEPASPHSSVPGRGAAFLMAQGVWRLR
jgi:nucleoside-diphosphate-sugar epimerase